MKVLNHAQTILGIASDTSVWSISGFDSLHAELMLSFMIFFLSFLKMEIHMLNLETIAPWLFALVSMVINFAQYITLHAKRSLGACHQLSYKIKRYGLVVKMIYLERPLQQLFAPYHKF